MKDTTAAQDALVDAIERTAKDHTGRPALEFAQALATLRSAVREEPRPGHGGMPLRPPAGPPRPGPGLVRPA